MPKPTIAAVNGFALGGGCELALACDLRYASPRAKLGQPEINLGIVPGWGGTQRLARVCGVGVAKELIFTGRTVDADEALRIGLVQEIADPVLERALEVARSLSAKSRVAMRLAKSLVNRAPTALQAEAEEFGALFADPDAKEGLAAFVEKREPRFSA
jgi:enoyl-CoA hydratase